jgi:hypothetical protein
MKKDINSFVGKSAKILICKNEIKISFNDTVAIFTANINNYDIDYNTDTLGGSEIINVNGNISIANQKICQFENDRIYYINHIAFYNNVQGEAQIDYKEVFCMLFIELRNDAGLFCDITMQSDKIDISL